MLEETEVLERYKFWLDAVAELFGGLDILSLEVVVSKDGIEQIIGVNDSALSLLGNQQEEDRKHIFDLIMERLEVCKRLMQFNNSIINSSRNIKFKTFRRHHTYMK